MVQPAFDKPLKVKKAIKGEGEIICIDLTSKSFYAYIDIDSAIYNYIDSVYPGISRNDFSFSLNQHSTIDYHFSVNVTFSFKSRTIYLWQYKSLPEWAR